MQNGYTFWDSILTNDCIHTQYNSLYIGSATKITNKNNKDTFYSLNSKDTTLTLKIKNSFKLCNQKLYQTEHPKLIVHDFSKDSDYNSNILKLEVNKIHNIDIFTYVNSKFVYVERHIGLQIDKLYRNIMIQICNLEKQLLNTILTLAYISPDHFAFNIMKKPGYMAKITGETVHISKCTPIEVTIADTKYCYEELPIKKNNQSYFLLPKTHIITKHGTQINCDPIAPQHYNIDGVWYKMLPKPIETTDIEKLHSNSKMTYNYKNTKDLSISGIYTQKDIEEHHHGMMFPINREAITSNIVRHLYGLPIENQQLINNIFNENSLERIVEHTWNKCWNKLITFGSISSAIIMIYIIFNTIINCTNTAGNAYLLYATFGWSRKLLAAFFSPITHMLLKTRKQRKKSTQIPYIVEFENPASDIESIISIQEPTETTEPTKSTTSTNKKPTPTPRKFSSRLSSIFNK